MDCNNNKIKKKIEQVQPKYFLFFKINNVIDQQIELIQYMYSINRF